MSPRKKSHEPIPRESATSTPNMEPSNDYPARSPWNPSPMLWHTGEDFEYKQKVDTFVSRIIETGGPADLDPNIRKAMILNYLSTQARLMQHNFECYQDLMTKQADSPEDLTAVLDKARDGLATQDELVKLIKGTPLVSLELSKLTHPYGERSEYLSTMLQYVEEAVVENGGVLYGQDDNQPVRIKINTHQHHTDHFIATSKVIIGEVDDVIIAKRTASVVLARDDLGFDSTVAKKMKQFASQEDPQKRHAQVFGQSGVKKFLEQADTTKQQDYMLPISTVYYAYREGIRKNEKTKKESDGSMAILSKLVQATGLIKKP